MIIRLVLALFISIVSGVCFLSGLTRLMAALLIGFGVCTALFFGLVFSFPAGSERITFALDAPGSPWPFFLLALVLTGLIVVLYTSDRRIEKTEQLGPVHLKFLGGGLLLYLISLFLPVVLWSPAEEAVSTAAADALALRVLAGVAVYLAGTGGALYLLFRSTRGGTEQNPDLMRRFVPALFSVFHLDKIPALVAYLLTYSSEPPFVYPKIAALGLAAYIPVSLFLILVCFSLHSEDGG